MPGPPWSYHWHLPVSPRHECQQTDLGHLHVATGRFVDSQLWQRSAGLTQLRPTVYSFSPGRNIHDIPYQSFPKYFRRINPEITAQGGLGLDKDSIARSNGVTWPKSYLLIHAGTKHTRHANRVSFLNQRSALGQPPTGDSNHATAELWTGLEPIMVKDTVLDTPCEGRGAIEVRENLLGQRPVELQSCTPVENITIIHQERAEGSREAGGSSEKKRALLHMRTTGSDPPPSYSDWCSTEIRPV
ncbi:hypothetical protein RRG08_014930 [Elysia crispata]|uniref:Uncharacterized protein n=1 Tax=Elysia crispata TaxID=231223 RepID=A0AAE1B0F8_9GAST|nr:hypothetical protein RRG08_014930 [Elysia crispata]